MFINAMNKLEKKKTKNRTVTESTWYNYYIS